MTFTIRSAAKFLGKVEEYSRSLFAAMFQDSLSNIDEQECVAEVVSSNWQNDYSRKLEDYEGLGIPEYWIADHAALGGIRHIGDPKQPTLSICTLVRGRYQIQKFRGDDVVQSITIPSLTLTAAQVLRIGKYSSTTGKAP